MATLVGVVTNDPKINNYIGWNVFDIAKEHSIEMVSDITDYFTEDNTAVQDHIAKKPIIINVSGYQGELVSAIEKPISMNLNDFEAINVQLLAQKLDVLNPLSPIMPTQATQARNLISKTADKYAQLQSLNYSIIDNINQATTSVNNLISAYDTRNLTLRGKLEASLDKEQLQIMQRQADAFNKFRYLRDNDILCTVFTPWGLFDNMAILSITPRQSEDSKYMSDFTISFKQFNSSETEYVKFDAQQFKNYVAEAQRDEMEKIGKSIGKQQNTSILRSLADPNNKGPKGALIK